MRFLAPARTAVAAATFDRPVFSPLAPWRGLLDGADWPGIDDLDARLSPLRHATTGRELHLVDQAGCALDGQHYETRIHAQGRIATRTDNWHDLFNALAWKRLPAVKSALNARQVADIARYGARQRTRGQDAMTQFDEAGAIVVLRDTALLASWDAHDWQELFLGQRQAWLDGTITLVIVGRAARTCAGTGDVAGGENAGDRCVAWRCPGRGHRHRRHRCAGRRGYRRRRLAARSAGVAALARVGHPGVARGTARHHVLSGCTLFPAPACGPRLSATAVVAGGLAGQAFR